MEEQMDWRSARRKRLRKRAGVALICVAIAVALRFVLSRLIGPDAPLWQRLVYFVAVYGPGLSGVMYFARGWFGFAVGFIVVILLALKGVVPEIWNVLLIITCLGLVIASVLYRKLRMRKLTNSTAAKEDSE